MLRLAPVLAALILAGAASLALAGERVAIVGTPVSLVPPDGFAERAVIARHDGQRSLMLRAANERLNAISAPIAKMWLSTTVQTAEGKPFRRFVELSLLRAQSPLFVLSWTIIHAIDETSPLFGLDEAALEAAQASIVVMIEGHDESAANTVRARKTYFASDIAHGHRYIDVLEPSDNDRVRINYTKFHLIEPDA